MPEIKLVVSVESADGVAKLRAFMQAVEAAAAAIQAETPALANATANVRAYSAAKFQAANSATALGKELGKVKLKPFGDEAEHASKGIGALSQHTGILTQALPEAGQAMSGLTAIIQGASAPLALMAVTLGLVIQQWTKLREVNLEYVQEANKAAISLHTQRAVLMAHAKQIDAEMAGNKIASLKAESEGALATIEGERQQRIEAAKERFEKDKSITDSMQMRKAQEQRMLLAITEADADASMKRKTIAIDLYAALRKESEAFAESERRRRADELDQDEQQARRRREMAAELFASTGSGAFGSGEVGQAVAARVAAAQEASGQVLEVIRTRYEAERALIEDNLTRFKIEQDSKVAAAEDAYSKIGRKAGVTMDEVKAAEDAVADARTQRDLLVVAKSEEAAARTATAWIGASQDIQRSTEAYHRSLTSLFEALGPGFEDLAAKFKGLAAADAARATIQQLDEALRVGDINAFQYADSVRRVNDQLAGVAPTTEPATTAITTMGAATDSAAQSSRVLTDAFDGVTSGASRMATGVTSAAQQIATSAQVAAGAWQGVAAGFSSSAAETFATGPQLPFTKGAEGGMGSFSNVPTYSSQSDYLEAQRQSLIQQAGGDVFRGEEAWRLMYRYMTGQSGLEFGTSSMVGNLLHPFQRSPVHYAEGGTVPGPDGAAQLAWVHGGERITPRGESAISFNISGDNPKAIAREVYATIQDLRRRGAL